MPPLATGAVALAAALDLAVGEPPERLHPVAWFGRAVAPLDRAWERPRLVGSLAAVGLPLAGAAAVALPTWLVATQSPVAGTVVAGLALWATISLRMLLGVASDVIDLTDEDLPAARERLRALAGRDAATLSAPQVRSAAVESAAENLADGLVATLGAFALTALVASLAGGTLPVVLAAAAGAAAWAKAVNTLDSMLGYRSKAVGGPSARLDDLVMWLPARLSAGLLAAAALAPASLAAARADARRPASPNSGWPMATLAAVLDVRLAKPGAYDLDLGPSLPAAVQARRGVRTVRRAGLLAAVLAGVVAWP